MYDRSEHITDILTTYRNNLPEADFEWPEKVQRSVNFIHKHLFNQQLTVRWMKNKCHIKGKNFSGKFKYYVGKTPRQYWLEHRVEAAKQLLTEEIPGEGSILEIALTVGFNSHSAFTMAFRKNTGYIPSDLRNGEI